MALTNIVLITARQEALLFVSTDVAGAAAGKNLKNSHIDYKGVSVVQFCVDIYFSAITDHILQEKIALHFHGAWLWSIRDRSLSTSFNVVRSIGTRSLMQLLNAVEKSIKSVHRYCFILSSTSTQLQTRIISIRIYAIKKIQE